MKKLFSLGSKKENAKQIDVTLNPKHIKFGVGLFIFALLFHMFIWSPYTEIEYKMVCYEDEIVVIEDGLEKVCDINIPQNMTAEEINNYLKEYLESKDKLGIL